MRLRRVGLVVMARVMIFKWMIELGIRVDGTDEYSIFCL